MKQSAVSRAKDLSHDELISPTKEIKRIPNTEIKQVIRKSGIGTGTKNLETFIGSGSKNLSTKETQKEIE